MKYKSKDFASILFDVFSIFIPLICVFLILLILSVATSINEDQNYALTSETIIVDKFITYSRYGSPRYYLIYKDDNGTILQRNVNPDVYYRFEIDVME